MRVLLLSAYDADSQRYWREWLVEGLRDWQWTVLALPPRHFSWRIRGNPLSWWQAPELNADYDLIVATSSVDLATLRGIRPGLALTPALLYCHENQFAYPRSDRQHPSIEPQMVQLYSVLAADRIAFNSEWNRDSCLAGIDALLARFPDAVPAGISEHVHLRSCVLPVGIAPEYFAPHQVAEREPLQLVWNHRWEYDKGPDLLLAALRLLTTTPIPFRLHLLGQSFRRQPPAFAEIRSLLRHSPGHLGIWGRLEDQEDYLNLLRQAHIVLSTAEHEFQGLAVQEAVAAGCVPLVPDRLSYPQWFGPGYRYGIDGDIGDQAQALVNRLQIWWQQGLPPIPDLRALAWPELLSCYRSELIQTACAWRGGGRVQPVS